MKSFNAAILAALLSSFSIEASEAVPGTSHARIDLQVERLWSENGATYAMIRVQNTASFDLAKVTVDCKALGSNHDAFDLGERTVVSPADGLMAPGAAKTLRILVATQDREVESMSCEARAL